MPTEGLLPCPFCHAPPEPDPFHADECRCYTTGCILRGYSWPVNKWNNRADRASVLHGPVETVWFDACGPRTIVVGGQMGHLVVPRDYRVRVSVIAPPSGTETPE